MTSPESDRPFEDVPPAGHEAHPHRRRQENQLAGWARAIALGVQDTAKAMLDEGRKGARRAYEEGWREYEAKTKHRRRGRD